VSAAPSSAPRPSGWVRFGQLVWVVASLLSLWLAAADFPYRFEQLRQFCLSVCEAGRLPPSEAPALQRLGLSLDEYAVYTMALYLTLTLVCWVVAGLIMWRRSHERIAVVAALALVALGPSSGLTLNTVVVPARAVFAILLVAGFVALVYLFYLFPDGRFVPGWTRWAIVPWFLWLGLLLLFVALRRPAPAPVWLVGTLLPLALFVLGGLAQIYRFTRVSTPTQRQQTKWVVAAFTFIIVWEMAYTIYFDVVRPALGQPPLSGALFEMADTATGVLSLLPLPLTLAIAIFRYRLWDIDVIIRRTLIYSIITVLLALAYFLSVLALQGVFGLLAGRAASPLVTVLSTLVIAALFVPLRSRVQDVIDRRFYRRHYDAARTLTTFGAALREHVELDALTERLLDVVEETIEPSSASLWLKDGDQPPTAGP